MCKLFIVLLQVTSPIFTQKLLHRAIKIYLQGLVLNDFLWIGTPYELKYAIDLKNALELNGFNSAISSFNADGQPGYIVPAKFYYFDSYLSRLMRWDGLAQVWATT